MGAGSLAAAAVSAREQALSELQRLTMGAVGLAKASVVPSCAGITIKSAALRCFAVNTGPHHTACGGPASSAAIPAAVATSAAGPCVAQAASKSTNTTAAAAVARSRPASQQQQQQQPAAAAHSGSALLPPCNIQRAWLSSVLCAV